MKENKRQGKKKETKKWPKKGIGNGKGETNEADNQEGKQGRKGSTRAMEQENGEIKTYGAKYPSTAPIIIKHVHIKSVSECPAETHIPPTDHSTPK